MMDTSRNLVPTRTLMVTGFKDMEALEEFKTNKVDKEKIKDIYTAEDIPKLFILFFDFRDAQEFLQEHNNSEIEIVHTISKYEIPRRGDDCGERNMQSSLNLLFKNTKSPVEDDALRALAKEYGDVREIRNSRPFQKTIEFCDMRDARKALELLSNKPYDDGVIRCRWVWDLSFASRIEYVRRTRPFQDLPTHQDNITDSMRVKRQRINSVPFRSVFIRLFDDFIVENLTEIEKMLRKI